MAKQARESVWILPEHWKVYLELFNQGMGINPATREVQSRFSLLVAHTREAIRQKCVKQDVDYSKGRGGIKGARQEKTTRGDGKKALVATVPVTTSVIRTLEDVEADIERYKTERITDVVKSIDILGLMDLLRKGEKYPAMEQRAIVAERGYLNMLTNEEAIAREEQRQKEVKMATEVAIRQGQLNPPLTGGKNPEGKLVPDFTYHIDCAPAMFISDKHLPDNVISEALFYSYELPIKFMLTKC